MTAICDNFSYIVYRHIQPLSVSIDAICVILAISIKDSYYSIASMCTPFTMCPLSITEKDSLIDSSKNGPKKQFRPKNDFVPKKHNIYQRIILTQKCLWPNNPILTPKPILTILTPKTVFDVKVDFDLSFSILFNVFLHKLAIFQESSLFHDFLPFSPQICLFQRNLLFCGFLHFSRKFGHFQEFFLGSGPSWLLS